MNKYRNLLFFVITIILSVNCSADTVDRHELAYVAYQKFLRSTIFLDSGEFGELDKNIQKIALIRTSDKSNYLLSKRTNTLIEDQIRDRIISGKRFQIIECLECKTVKVTIKDNKLVREDFTENNEHMRKYGRKLDIDAFMFWEAFIEGNRVIVNFKLIKATDGKILWTRQYNGPYDPTAYDHFSLDIYIGMLGYNLTRTPNTGGINAIKLDNMAKAGLRLREKFSALDRIEFSIGAEYFGPLSKRSKFDFNGILAEARMVIDILPLMKHLRTNVYVSGGPAFYNSELSAFVRYGIEIPFQRFGYISFGGQYMPEKDVDLGGLTNFNNTAKFGGSSYDLTIGIRL